jgi:hypothetical protein
MDRLWLGTSSAVRCSHARKRVHTGYEYQGSADQTRIWSEDLDHDEVVRWLGELFNLADQSYSRPSKI